MRGMHQKYHNQARMLPQGAANQTSTIDRTAGPDASSGLAARLQKLVGAVWESSGQSTPVHVDRWREASISGSFQHERRLTRRSEHPDESAVVAVLSALATDVG